MDIGTNGAGSATTGEREVIEVTKFRAGDRLFQSNGYSYVKVTRDGRAAVLRLAIRSTGLTEVMDKLRAMEPAPPTTAHYVSWDSEHGKALRMTPAEGRRWVYAPNLADPEYKRKIEAYNKDLTLETINQALVGDFEDEQGQPVTDRAGKARILEGMGIAPEQFNQLVQDIKRLTELSEGDREHFFAISSGATPPTLGSTGSPRASATA